MTDPRLHSAAMLPLNGCPAASRRMAGFGLIEALISGLVLSAGMVLLLKGHAALREHSDFARERAAAAVLAEAQVERLRALPLVTSETPSPGASSLAASPPVVLALPGLPSPDDPTGPDGLDSPSGAASPTPPIPPALGAADPMGQTPTSQGVWQIDHDTTRYDLHQQLTPVEASQLRDLDLQLRWQDRTGAWQQLDWPARIGSRRMHLSLLALRTTPPGDVDPAADIHAAVPHEARLLGQDWAVFQPDPTLHEAWLLDVRTGTVRGLCDLGLGTVDDLTSADVAGCQSQVEAGGALLLSGQIRFDLSATPTPDAPHSPALAGGLQLALTGGEVPPAPPRCVSNAALAAAQGLDVVSYHCLVYPRTSDHRWSGRTLLTGPMADLQKYRVCRYSADHDHDGHIANIEHPAVYDGVDGPLLQQNFLVVRATLPCPAGAPPDAAQGRLLDSRTVSHQPQD